MEPLVALARTHYRVGESPAQSYRDGLKSFRKNARRGLVCEGGVLAARFGPVPGGKVPAGVELASSPPVESSLASTSANELRFWRDFV